MFVPPPAEDEEEAVVKAIDADSAVHITDSISDSQAVAACDGL